MHDIEMAKIIKNVIVMYIFLFGKIARLDVTQLSTNVRQVDPQSMKPFKTPSP